MELLSGQDGTLLSLFRTCQLLTWSGPWRTAAWLPASVALRRLRGLGCPSPALRAHRGWPQGCVSLTFVPSASRHAFDTVSDFQSSEFGAMDVHVVTCAFPRRGVLPAGAASKTPRRAEAGGPGQARGAGAGPPSRGGLCAPAFLSHVQGCNGQCAVLGTRGYSARHVWAHASGCGGPRDQAGASAAPPRPH